MADNTDTPIGLEKHEPPAGSTNRHLIARSIALFLGLFDLLNSVGVILGHTANQNIWWIDFSFLSGPMEGFGSFLAILLQICAGIALLFWSVSPSAIRRNGDATAVSRHGSAAMQHGSDAAAPQRGGSAATTYRRNITAVLIAILALIAMENTVAYWILLGSGQLYAASPVPLSALIAAGLTWLAIVVFRTKEVPTTKRRDVGLLVVGLCVVTFVFPLLQIGFFGTTDYRRTADAAIVLGAKVHEDGTLSVALKERMDTAIELYDEDYVPTLIVSGGTGSEGVNEAEAMRDYAMSAGVPAADIIVDPNGVSTEATVDDTIAIMRSRNMGRVIVTSSFYHLPRIKMMYLLQDVDVLTVPTFGNLIDNKTYKSLWREIPGWWLYWLEGTLLA